MRVGEAILFGGAALALHGGLFLTLPALGTAATDGEAAEAIALRAASPALAETVARWRAAPDAPAEPTVGLPAEPTGPADRPAPAEAPSAVPPLPDAVLPPSDPGAPTLPEAPARPPAIGAEPALPRPEGASAAEGTVATLREVARREASGPLGAPSEEGQPAIDDVAPPNASTSAVALSPRPELRGERRAPAPQPTATTPARSTSGSGGETAAPIRAPQPAPGPSAGQLRSAQAQWAAAIDARIQRQARRPAGAPSGAARVRIAVAPSGRVVGVSLAASSGSPALDRAAVAAVQRVGRFPAAPQVLHGRQASYGFTLTVRF